MRLPFSILYRIGKRSSIDIDKLKKIAIYFQFSIYSIMKKNLNESVPFLQQVSCVQKYSRYRILKISDSYHSFSVVGQKEWGMGWNCRRLRRNAENRSEFFVDCFSNLKYNHKVLRVVHEVLNVLTC